MTDFSSMFGLDKAQDMVDLLVFAIVQENELCYTQQITKIILLKFTLNAL